MDVQENASQSEPNSLRRVISYVAVVVVGIIVMAIILAFLGPAIGNVYSDSLTNL